MGRCQWPYYGMGFVYPGVCSAVFWWTNDEHMYNMCALLLTSWLLKICTVHFFPISEVERPQGCTRKIEELTRHATYLPYFTSAIMYLFIYLRLIRWKATQTTALFSKPFNHFKLFLPNTVNIIEHCSDLPVILSLSAASGAWAITEKNTNNNCESYAKQCYLTPETM